MNVSIAILIVVMFVYWHSNNFSKGITQKMVEISGNEVGMLVKWICMKHLIIYNIK